MDWGLKDGEVGEVEDVASRGREEEGEDGGECVDIIARCRSRVRCVLWNILADVGEAKRVYEREQLKFVGWTK